MIFKMPLASFIVICYNNKEVIFGLLLPVFDWRIIFSKFNKERTVTMRVLEREYLPRSASPEEAGVSSVAVAAFMEDMKKSGIENHSFLILRHGKVAAECFFCPFYEGYTTCDVFRQQKLHFHSNRLCRRGGPVIPGCKGDRFFPGIPPRSTGRKA